MQTPLWLDLKKEYIDDNFEKLLVYLKNKSLNEDTDTFYDETVGLLRERVGELVARYGALPVYEDPDANECHFSIRLLAAYLLLGEGGQLSVSAYLTLMFLLLQHKRECSLQIMKNVSECLRHSSIKNKGFYWGDIIDYSPDIFAHKAIKNVAFGAPLSKNYIYNGFGTAILSSKSLYICPASAENSRKLLTTGTDSLAIEGLVALRTASANKLKQSLETNLVEMDKYVTEFCETQMKAKQTAGGRRLKSYSDGDEANVTVTRVDYVDKIIYVETVDSNYDKLSGRIAFSMPSVMYYYTSTLSSFFEVGNTFPATITNAASGIFSIEKELTRYLVELCRRTNDPEYSIASVLIDKNSYQYVWLTTNGFPVYTNVPEETYEKGDYAWIIINKIGEAKHYGKIFGNIDEPYTETSDTFIIDARRNCISGFATSAMADAPKKKAESNVEAIDGNLLAMLIRLMFTYQMRLLKPSDRFRYLMNARAIACLTGDVVSESYIRFASTYLMILVQFTNNADISAMRLTPDEVYKDAASATARMLIVDILKRCGHDDNSDFLSRIIEEYRESVPTISKLARLVQTINTTSDMLSGSAINIIRREIIRTLSIETENDTNLEDDSREYIGVESSTQEFKESIVFPPDNHMQPSPTTQARNVMRGICAFLNSETGGTLYIGVNDQGYVVGIENDMKALKCYTIDSYTRYVLDKAIEFMGVDAASYINIEPMYDNRCLAIQVSSHPRIIEIENKAYIRINNETREMPESTREKMVERKYQDTLSTAQSLFLLHQAKSRQLKVVLHNYSSSSSRTVSDREVEAYDIRQDDSLVIGYDLVRKATRIFKVNRIGYVEVTNEPWSNTSHHEKVDVDDFRMTGTKPIAVSLQLDLFSCNLLREEFPSSRKHLTQDKNDEDRWFYNAEVYQMDGIGRFYIGLANHITILKAPELVAYIDEYKKKYL